jgi:hypothetical protein
MSMKRLEAFGIAAIAAIMIAGPVAAADLKDRVKVEVSTVGLHPGMDPGLYVCASNHLHIKGTVHNLADVPVGQVKVTGRAFDGAGKLLGTATTTTKTDKLAPGQKSEINLEFLTVTGPAISQVKRHEVSVAEAPSL